VYEGKGIDSKTPDLIKIQKILAIFTVNEELSNSVAQDILPYEDLSIILGSVNYSYIETVSPL